MPCACARIPTSLSCTTVRNLYATGIGDVLTSLVPVRAGGLTGSRLPAGGCFLPRWMSPTLVHGSTVRSSTPICVAQHTVKSLVLHIFAGI